MKRIDYYKVRVEGIQPPSSLLQNNACFEHYTEAVHYLETGWQEYCGNFLQKCGRKVINEYKTENVFGYKHQISIVSDTGYVQVVMLAVDNHTLTLR